MSIGSFLSHLGSGLIDGIFGGGNVGTGEGDPSLDTSSVHIPGLEGGDPLSGGKQSESIFSSLPTSAISAGLTAAASLFSGIYGTNLSQQQLDEMKRQYDATLEFNKQQLEQQKLLTEEQIAASQNNAAAMAGASKFASKVNLLGLEAGAAGRTADRAMAARAGRPELTLKGREAQSQAAETTGKLGIDAFANLIGAAQRPLTR